MITYSKDIRYACKCSVLALPIIILVFIVSSFTIVKAQRGSRISVDDKMTSNKISSVQNSNDTTVIASVKFTKHDGTIGSIIMPVTYSTGIPNSSQVSTNCKDTTVNITFVKHDGTAGSITAPVRYAISVRN